MNEQILASIARKLLEQDIYLGFNDDNIVTVDGRLELTAEEVAFIREELGMNQ